ncbi:LisH domain-containing protein [Caenorhabditis elegans]|uniref:LisH domain-containing protein n=2 Tax=Caenorhabditis elegans TaxID=6239 RepID=O61952_CAEEL|nr:LisH domain-containing protein [Caenorhabditis elegans]CCD63577.1 LisH domain-containing protein [Caenorhabditis elegans]|eukprot:NP_504002.2 Uncharacterized protein CELE_T24A6.16 [Caenorhabditis elegans]
MHKLTHRFGLTLFVLLSLYFVSRRFNVDNAEEISTKAFIKPFISYAPSFFTAPDNKLIACEISKSMSQLTLNLMCLLYNETQYLADNNSFSDTWATSNRSCTKEFNFLNPSEVLKIDKNTVRFAFVRDPFRRFVSLYLNKCVNKNECYDCGSDMRCVVEKIYNSFYDIQNSRNETLKIGHIEAHAAPVTWNCNFHQGIEKWELLAMGSDTEERVSSAARLADILRKQGVRGSLVEKIHKNILTAETAHSTHKSSNRYEAERQVREDPFVRDYLHKIYLFDYLVFPFDRRVLDTAYQKIDSKLFLEEVAK